MLVWNEPTQHAVAAAAIFLCGIGGASLPLWVDGCTRYSSESRDRFLHVGSVFGGGIFVGAGFIHLLPDAAEKLDGDPLFDGYPAAFGLASFGVLLTMVVEVAALTSVVSRGEVVAAGDRDWSNNGDTHSDYAIERTFRFTSIRQSPGGEPGYTSVTTGEPDARAPSANGDASTAVATVTEKDPLLKRRRSSADAVSSLVAVHSVDRVDRIPSGRTPVESIAVGDAIPPQTSRFAAVAMFLVLSFHSFIAGVALGVDDSAFSSIFMAVVAHKTIAAFALGTAFVRAHKASSETMSRGVCFLWMLAFSLVTPTGIGVGTVLSAEAVDGRVTAILSAIAAGTFLHVGLIEVLGKEVVVGAKDLTAKVIAMLTGWGIMALIALWV